jgi:CHAT domain-containing protein/TPR repeat protein
MSKGFGKKTTKKVSKRQKAYFKLIGKLLNCPRGQEEKVLTDNQHLIDAGLVQAMRVAAVGLAKEGELKSAQFLIGIAGYLSEDLESSGPTENMSNFPEKEYFGKFLLQIMLADDNPDGTRPILQTYLQQDPYFIQKLRSWLMAKISKATPKEAIGYASVLSICGTAISSFPLGDTAENLEEAIACLEVAWSVLNQNKLPDSRILKPEITHLLAIAYCERIKGDKAENIELAIAKFEEALELITRESESELWGQIKNSLGIAYRDRIWGDKADNLELAIAALEDGLQVRTRNEFPEKWAQSKMNLAVAYRHRVRGDKAKNLELSITENREALQVYNPQQFPEDWAGVNFNLGNVYLHRIQGEKSDNLEKAIACYKNALQVITKNKLPFKWAMAKMSLGNAYRDSNITEAIACYREAFEIFTPTNFPENCFLNGTNMGYAAFFAELWPEAIEGFSAAVEAVEQNLNWAESEARRQEIKAEATHIYEKLITACVKNGQLDLAKEYATRSSSLRLVNKLANNDLDLDSDKEIVDFCIQVLESSFDSNGNAQVLYPILEANLDKLDDKFAMVLRGLGERIQSQIKPEQLAQLSNLLKTNELAAEIGKEQVFIIATLMGLLVFSSLILRFPKGNKGTNIEIAIVGYEVLENIFTREGFPQQWAGCQSELGSAYRNRFRGDRESNLEKAIAYCQNALQIVAPESDTQMWGFIQTNLATCYSDRIKGDRSQNQELAISYCQEVLEVCIRDEFPEQWGNAASKLGTFFLEKASENRAENLEKAIYYYTEAAKVLTFEQFPVEWSCIQDGLGLSYSNRIKGDRLDNLKQAIEYFQTALKVRTREDFPQDWVKTLSHLGSTCQAIDSPESIERAIECYETALEVATLQEMPTEWAMLHTNLGGAYSDRSQGDKISNIKSEINHYEAALQVYTRRAYPQHWASLQNNLGLFYGKLGQVEKQIQYLQLSLEACEAFPKDWAGTQYNLGLAYRELGVMPEAVNCFRLSLEVFTPKAFPVDCFDSGDALGNLEFKGMRWEEAIKAYELAIEAIETTRNWTPSESRRQAIMENVIDVYFNMVQACINAGDLKKALEYAERSKSKLLVDIMASNDRYQTDNIPPEVEKLLQQYNDLQQQIDRERRQQTADTTRETKTDRASFHAYNQIVDRLESEKQNIWERLRRLDPVLAGEIQVSAPDIPAMQRLIDKPTSAILSFYNTSSDTHIFILRKDCISLHTCPQQGIEGLQRYIAENWLSPYLPREGETKDEKKQRQSEGFHRLDSILDELGDRLQLNDLIARHLDGIEELIIVPHLLLHLIPFGAIAISDSPPRYLGDKFLIRYAPSCQILEFCHQRGEVDAESFQYGIVEDAQENLPCAAWEGDRLAELLGIPATNRLRGKSQATCHNYRQLAEKVQVLHSCHHAESRLDKPLESVLKLSDGDITLGQLMSPGWRLPHLSDVFLSCCETGLGMPALTDDILTLAAGFLCVGARSVVNTLWSVDDLATALVCTLYYRRRQQGESRPQALWGAQMELRNFSQDDFKELSRQVEAKRKEAKRRNQDREYHKYSRIRIQLLDIQNSSNQPFSHREYWAAFTCQGLS